MTDSLVNDFLACINSYLWLLKHHKSYKIRKHLLDLKVNAIFWENFWISEWYNKVVLKRKMKLKLFV
jgi:hypothetical protein